MARTLREKLNPFDKESRKKRKVKKQAMSGKKESGIFKETKSEKRFAKKGTQKITESGRRKQIKASKGTTVSKGAVSIEKTKGGEYVKYKKDSKAASSFRETFKAKCVGDSKGFTWQGRKYSCAKK